jgi:hypothetical protein
VGVFAAATDRIRLNDACRERRGLLMSLSFVTRQQHPFTDDLTPQIVVGSHHDFLKFATLFSDKGRTPDNGRSQTLGFTLSAFLAAQERPSAAKLKTVAAWSAAVPETYL